MIIVLLGDSKVGKSTFISRCKAVCPWCVFTRVVTSDKDESDGPSEEEQNQKKTEQGKNKAYVESKWNMEHRTPHSLKWYARHTILTKGIPYVSETEDEALNTDNSINNTNNNNNNDNDNDNDHKLAKPSLKLPDELIDYINEVDVTHCPSCSMVSIQYMDPTKKCVFFEKEWNENEGVPQVSFIDTISWEELKLEVWALSLIHNPAVLVLIYSINSRRSFEAIEDILQFQKETSPQEHAGQQRKLRPCVMIFGNHMGRKREVLKEEGQELAQKYEATIFAEISSRNDNTALLKSGVEQTLQKIRNARNRQTPNQQSNWNRIREGCWIL